MGDLVGIREKAIKAGTLACQLDKEKKYEEAFQKYIESIEYFNHVIKCNYSSVIINSREERKHSKYFKKEGWRILKQSSNN